MPKTLHFKSKDSYQRYLAYKHMHGLDKGGKNPVEIAGKAHKVNHSLRKISKKYGKRHERES